MGKVKQLLPDQRDPIDELLSVTTYDAPPSFAKGDVVTWQPVYGRSVYEGTVCWASKRRVVIEPVYELFLDHRHDVGGATFTLRPDGYYYRRGVRSNVLDEPERCRLRLVTP